MATTTSTTTMDAAAARRRLAKRRLSILGAHEPSSGAGNAWKPLSPSMVAAELSSARPSQGVLVSLRIQVLQYLADLEDYLSSAVDNNIKGEITVEEARAWARTGLDMLVRIRSDVQSHLPDLHLDGSPDSVCARLSDAMPDVRSRIDDVRSRISDIDFHRPLDYIPTLHDHLQSLQAHLSLLEHSLSESVAMLTPSTTLHDLIQVAMSSETVTDLAAEIKEGEEMLERAAVEIAHAIKRSLNGSQLIHYADLPERWKNNHFVTRGYRFIPLQQWPQLVFSVFAWHNETLNIHTHFIPFLLWSMDLVPVAPFWTNAFYETHQADIPIFVYSVFSLLCLFTSSVWHTMAGCASPKGMELCARVDYVGIGWLISASVSTFVYYGFEGYPTECKLFMGLCLLMGLSGTILPFCSWFNQRKYRAWRNAYFVSLPVASVAPVAYLCFLHPPSAVLSFLANLAPSIGVYLLGFIIYATHFPEGFLNPKSEHHWLDWVGGGSHAIWHVCVVLGISLHRWGMAQLAKGIPAAVVA
ncbi:putative G-protein coupled receptor [Cristinia sonorae]|uniref:G-protein coupled receptor n=1 Tax=Cristinia sonorae TaxID=1940300 RepID=A0A8K0XWC2_9AGAR|nr:putative G-protein coupled receptor [Cristinia sonorae]